ncbi:MAG TPA: hypothetical protein VHD81_12405 [Mycobacteriales bacterium]|nr:hypothetical protein [Mycobacteriales bacterium]
MKPRRTRWSVALAAALAAPAIAAPLAIAGTSPGGAGVNTQACRRTHGVIARTDGWTSIRPPANLLPLLGATADPRVLRRIYAWNATSVARSDDGGCSWRTVFDAPATVKSIPGGAAASHVTQVAVADGVWVTTATSAGRVGTSTVWHSANGTGSYTFAGAGLPPAATVTQLQPTNKAGVAYALVQTVTDSQLYASSPGLGNEITWQHRFVPGLGSLTAISADPNIADIIDVASANAYSRSPNGGDSFTITRRTPGRITAIDASGANLDVYLESGRLLAVAGGRTRAIGAPSGVLSATHVSLEPGVRAISTPHGDYGYDPTKHKWQLISPLGLVAQHLQLVAPALPPVLYGIAAGFIYELPLSFPAAFITEPPLAHRPGEAVSLHGVAGFGSTKPSFAPAPHIVTLQVGQRQVAHYLLRVPARSGPLDVDFLVDTTNSMLPAISGLRHGMQQIIETLSHTTPNLQVGLADFRDYNDGEGISLPGGSGQIAGGLLHKHHLYVLDQRIAPVGPSLGRALGRLSAAGGGDVAEADTTAVMQAITGSGVPGWVEPGQEAGFRPDATKVIVLITDAPMHLHSPYPTLTATTDALRAYDVRLVGISINDGLNDAAADLRSLASGSRTDAPEGGLACHADGRPDVPAGAPMVCSVPITGAGIAVLAGPVARLIEQVVAPGLLSVHLHSSRPSVASLAGASREHANLHAKSRLPVTVVYNCPVSAAGSRTPINLSGAVGSTTVAHTSVVLRCLPTPPTVAVPPAVVVAPAVAAQPPPPPLTSNINPNVNPGTGAATNEEQQSQLALADLNQSADTEPAVNDNGPDMGAPMLYAAALLLTGAAALAFRVRTQPQPNLARVRRKGTR